MRESSLGSRLCAIVPLVLACAGLLATDQSDARGFRRENLFDEEAISRVSISPSGEWIVAFMQYQNRYGISAQRRGDAIAYTVHVSRGPLRRMRWVGDDDLMFEFVNSAGYKRLSILRFFPEEVAVKTEVIGVGQQGTLVDPLIGQDGFVLWGSSDRRSAYVFRVPITELEETWNFTARDGKDPNVVEVARVRDGVDRWVTDSKGVVRAYLWEWWDDGPRYTLGYRDDESTGWRKIDVQAGKEEGKVDPMGFTSDGERLIVIAYAGRDTAGLHELDPETGTFQRELFVDPDVDVTDVIFDHNGSEVIAAVYAKGGQIRHAYLGDYKDRHLSGVESRTRGETVRVVSSSLDRGYFVLLAYGPTNPGTYYYYAKKSDTWTKLADALLGVTAEELVPLRPIHVVSKDGTRVEGFLTLPSAPEDGSLRPLFVVPHGGPIDVADGTKFDPLAQYLALSGVAVLQINYRGSSGYGRKFLTAGLRANGRGIEDDIDAVVQATIDAGHVDPDRMCIGGGSYGGYSALMSAIRFPHRYRCVITLAGVSDVPLKFDSSDWSVDSHARKVSMAWWGDPETDFEEMIEVSPVYRVPEIQVPVLIAHGTLDERVDPEHAHRLRAMMEAHGKPYEWLAVEGGRHSPTRSEWVRYASAMRVFLREHLGKTPRHVPPR